MLRYKMTEGNIIIELAFHLPMQSVLFYNLSQNYTMLFLLWYPIPTIYALIVKSYLLLKNID